MTGNSQKICLRKKTKGSLPSYISRKDIKPSKLNHYGINSDINQIDNGKELRIQNRSRNKEDTYLYTYLPISVGKLLII